MNTLYCKGYIKPNYPVHVSNDATFSDLLTLLPITQKRFVILDEKIIELFPKLVSQLRDSGAYIFPISANEKNKSLYGLEELFTKIFELKPSRDDTIVAIGGGMVMNLGGLAASLVMRGVRFYYVPTTLTGQIDASLGSKQAINFMSAKNWIGMFNDPEFCYMNPTFLHTTTRREFNSQAIEGIKLCLATNKDLFETTLDDLNNLHEADSERLGSFITKMIEAKIDVVEKDLTEENYGMSMLYGHTIGHAIEMIDPGHINHGEGVGLGMLAAARISHMLGIASKELVTMHEEILEKLNLPSKIPTHIIASDITAKLAHNKKNYASEIRFVLLKSAGVMAKNDDNYFTTVPHDIIEIAIREGY